jgi:hypothetical protein
MAVAWFQEFEFEDRSTTNYDAVSGRLGLDANPAVGLIAHTAGFDDDNGVFRIFDVWESREHAQRFQDERLLPILGEMLAGENPPPGPIREGFYDLHDVIDG